MSSCIWYLHVYITFYEPIIEKFEVLIKHSLRIKSYGVLYCATDILDKHAASIFRKKQGSTSQNTRMSSHAIIYYKLFLIRDLQSLLKNYKSAVCRLQVMPVMLLTCMQMLYALFKQTEVHPIQAGNNLRLSTVSMCCWNDSSKDSYKKYLGLTWKGSMWQVWTRNPLQNVGCFWRKSEWHWS
jgi:hypothetical protein